MKNKTLSIIAVSLLTLSACTKPGSSSPSSSTSTSTSTYDITLNGHSYHRLSSSQTLPIIVVSVGSTLNDCQVNISINDAPNITAWFWGEKSDTTNKVGTYQVIGGLTSNQTIQDNGYNITYLIAPNTGSTNSGTITISLYTTNEIKGTFSVYGTTDDINFYNITGDFDYKH